MNTKVEDGKNDKVKCSVHAGAQCSSQHKPRQTDRHDQTYYLTSFAVINILSPQLRVDNKHIISPALLLIINLLSLQLRSQ